MQPPQPGRRRLAPWVELERPAERHQRLPGAADAHPAVPPQDVLEHPQPRLVAGDVHEVGQQRHHQDELVELLRQAAGQADAVQADGEHRRQGGHFALALVGLAGEHQQVRRRQPCQKGQGERPLVRHGQVVQGGQRQPGPHQPADGQPEAGIADPAQQVDAQAEGGPAGGEVSQPVPRRVGAEQHAGERPADRAQVHEQGVVQQRQQQEAAGVGRRPVAQHQQPHRPQHQPDGQAGGGQPDRLRQRAGGVVQGEVRPDPQEHALEQILPLDRGHAGTTPTRGTSQHPTG